MPQRAGAGMARRRSCSLKTPCPPRPTAGCRPRPKGLQCCLSAKTRGRLDSSMSLTKCTSCKHDNPADAKFCGACGGALHLPAYLASCARCGTVNPVKATICCWCQGPLAARRSSRRPSPVIVGTAVLATVAALGYYTYPQFSLVDARQSPAAGGENGAARSPAAVLLETAPPETVPPETAPPETALADPTRAAANQPPAGRQPVEAPAAKAAAVAIARPQAINAGKEGERAPSRQEACTEAGAALGLCVAKSVQKKEAAAVEAAIKRPQATGAGNAGGQEPPCTEAVAALGLCTPKPTQRRE
jgi:hypothetical protein